MGIKYSMEGFIKCLKINTVGNSNRGFTDLNESGISIKFKFKFKLSFIVIPLHVWTYSGTRCRASQDHGAT